MSHAFKINGTAQQVEWIKESIAGCSFDFDRVIPGLQRQTGRSQVDVSYKNLGSGIGGMASSAGWIQISSSLGKVQAQDVFIMEAAHSVDFFLITNAHRQAIYDLFHPAGPDSHSWFEPSTYWNQVGEAFMYLFVWAYTSSRPVSSFLHKPTEAMAVKLREVLGGTVPPLPPQPPQPPLPPPPATHPVLDLRLTGSVGGRSVTFHGTAVQSGSGDGHANMAVSLSGSIPFGLFGGSRPLALAGTAIPRRTAHHSHDEELGVHNGSN